jgi:cobalt-zinc-cadmium efflux system outer membrane protein
MVVHRFVAGLVSLLVVLSADGSAAQPTSLPDTLTFEQATALLLEHNPQLRAVRSRAQAEAQAADNAARYPNPTLTVSEERTNLEGDGVDDQWYLNLNQPLDYPGETRARRRSADAVETAAEARTREVAADLFRELRRRYLAVVEAQARHDVLARVTKAVQQAARAGEVRYEEGDLGTFQRARLQVARARYENDRADAERTLRTARAELAVLLLPSAQASVDSLRAAQMPPVDGRLSFRSVTVDATAAIQRARSERGRLTAARARLEAERQTLDATRYQRYPSLSLSAGPKRQSLPGSDTYGYTAGLHVGLPLWNGGGAAVDAQRGRREAAAADLEAARRAVEFDVVNALQRVDSYRDRLQSLSDDVLAGSDALRTDALFVYQEGEIGLFELLDALDAARESALLRTRLTADYLRSLYDLAFALGVGPTEDPLVVRGALMPRDPSLAR